jgi:diguanylate cyclase (GGDEF)-like protein
MESIANMQIARAMRDRPSTALTRAKRSVVLLSNTNRILLRATALQPLLEDVCRLAVDQGGYRLAWIGQPVQDDAHSVIPVVKAGPSVEYLDGIRISWAEGDGGHGPTGRAIREGRTIKARFIQVNPAFAPWRREALAHGLQSSISLPLRVGDQIWGALALYAAEPDAFNDDETSLLEEIAEDIAFGIGTVCLREFRDLAEERLRQSAYTDIITGLPNRASLVELLEGALARGEQGALLFINLDRFREVNDTQGHLIGDAALQAVGERLAGSMDGWVTLGHVGGGEFALVIPEADELVSAEVADKLIRILGTAFGVKGSSISLSARIGIALYPRGQETPAEIFAHAALASRESAADNKCYRFYSPEMSVVLAERLELAEALKRAMTEGGLNLHYQPKTDMRSGKLVGAEALLRWQEPVRGPIPPSLFIPIAEERGLMPEVGLWALKEACRQLAAWKAAGLRFPGRLAVNVSARQLDTPNFAATLRDIVASYDCSPTELELEITESVMANDVRAVIAILEEIKAMGFTFAIDDFGTGFSSLAYLSQFPAGTLKIDMSFVRNMLKSANDNVIVETIIGMAKSLGLTTVAEGVETEQQLQALVALGCPVAQGYYFGHPEPAESFALRWLEDVGI